MLPVRQSRIKKAAESEIGSGLVMNRELFEEENLYSTGEFKLCKESRAAISAAIESNQAVGVIAGYYDEDLTIAYVSEFFLHNLGYSYDEFIEAVSGSLKKVFYGEDNKFIQNERFVRVHGESDAQMLNKEGVPVNIRAYKTDSFDKEGIPLWILSAHIDDTQKNLKLANQVIRSGFWSVKCDQDGNPTEAFFSHEFRTMLGYHDVLDFPNRLETWKTKVHPDDIERVVRTFYEALSDQTNETKFDVEYRICLADGSCQWFKDRGEVSRRTDGTAFCVAGVFVNIDKEKKEKQYIQRVEAFYRTFAKANLCEYYVDLKENRFDSLKVEKKFAGLFEGSSTWDEMTGRFVDAYVVHEDREKMRHFYDRAYVAGSLAEGRGEINQECRIVVKGELRWVRNVIIRYTEGDTVRYALSFVRDITDAKREQISFKELIEQNRIKDQLIRGIVNLVDRYAACDLEQDSYYSSYRNL